ncbi:hypothetical protein HPB51_018826 [Rhipicephalus microplus]|uniref:Uncharacterized protein n=1 Tax=Rhipicephalus microplus TaxID=6941 RepID=A0A9J6DBJ7_RHIMP|nr:hypothetical protein HPB51_018826 [Rhipicephalus microplus]
MTDYRMDDEASDVSDNDEEDFGWQVAAGRRSRAKKSSKAANAMPCNSQESSGDAATGVGRRAANATGAFKNHVVKASRMPQLPEELHKFIIRPRGRTEFSKVSTMAIGTAVIEASSLTAQQANEDVVYPNFTQNIIVVSTPEPDNAARRVDIRDSQSAITTIIVHERNPLALAAKLIKTSGSVIVLFDGLRVPKFVRYGPTLSPQHAREPHLHTHVQVLRRRPPHRRQNVQEAVSSTLCGTGPPKGTRPVVIGHEGAHGDAKPTQEPQKPLTLSEFLEIQAPLATPEEQLLQVERSAGELRIRSAWCHAGCWDHLGR